MTPYLEEKGKKISFVFRDSGASSQDFSDVETKQNIFHRISPRITLQTTSHTCFRRFHHGCTVHNHTMLVFEGLLNEWDKIWNDLIGIWLESLVHGYTIRANSGFC